MNALINISQSNGSRAVSARELHEFLEVGKDFSTWIKNRIDEYDFAENEDFSLLPNFGEQNGRGGHNKIEYALSIDMAKELAMVEKNAKGKQARRYFIAVEKQARNPQLSVSSKTLIETRRQQRDELMLLIRNNFMQGDIKKVALDNNWRYETVRSVVKCRHFNAAIAQALFNQAMANKQNENSELQGMIEHLKLNF